MKFEHIALRAFNKPVLLEPSYAAIFYGFLGSRIEAGTVVINDATEELMDNEMGNRLYGEIPDTVRPGYTVVGNTAIVPIDGTLVHRNGNNVRPSSGLTGMDGIETNIKLAEKSPTVQRVVFDINSNGGEATGVFELAAMIADMEKPTMAYVNESAYSGAYAIASACDVICLPDQGGVGSIGVLMAHTSFERRLEAEGIEVTLMYKGDRKADGHPAKSLSKEAIARIDARQTDIYETFTSFVADNRGLTVSDVKNTQALTFHGEQAVKIGLADYVMSKDDAFEAFLNGSLTPSNGTSGNNGRNQMSDKTAKAKNTTAKPSDADDVNVVSEADHAAAVAASHKDGLDAGVAQERQRVLSILQSDGGKAHPTVAQTFVEQGLSADAANAALDAIPTGQTSVTQDALNNDTGAGVEDLPDTVEETPNGSSAPVLMAI